MKKLCALVVFALGVAMAGEKPSEPWKLSQKERIAQAREDAEKRAAQEEEKRARLSYERAKLDLPFESGQFRL